MEMADIPGVFLPWQDVLHEGPVPEGLALEELSEVRAKYIIDQGWGAREAIERAFRERDNTLKSFGDYEKVILWFEHDLYDQLQMLQILAWFHENRPKKDTLSIICVDRYLGMLSPDEMAALYQFQQTVNESQLALANTAWSAFRASSPEQWFALLKTETSALPFLNGAIVRLLEEYPSCFNGLSRTARQALEIICQVEKKPGRVFALYQESEERRFLGDLSFWKILNECLTSTPPLLAMSTGKEMTLPANPDQELSITEEGKEVLSGNRNWLELVQLDRWIGGVHLTSDHIWCWDSGSASIAKRT